MSNLNFAGPTPDDNVTLSQARDYVKRLGILFPNNPASIIVVGPVTIAAYPIGGKTKLGDEISSEQDLVDAGVDPDNDPVEASLKFANVASFPMWAAAAGRLLNRARKDDFDHLVLGIFGLDTNVEFVRMQTIIHLLSNPATASLSIPLVMQGKTPAPPAPPTKPNDSNPFGPQK